MIYQARGRREWRPYIRQAGRLSHYIFCNQPMGKTVKQLAVLVGGQVIGDEDLVVSGVSGIKEAKAGEITFVANRKYYCPNGKHNYAPPTFQSPSLG